MPIALMRRSNAMTQLIWDLERLEPTNHIRNAREPERLQAQHGLRERWGRWWNTFTAACPSGMRGGFINRKAQQRGFQLLQENLSPMQQDQYKKRGYFEVIGGESGRRYRIRRGHQMNVEQLDKHGRCVCKLCFMPEGYLVVGDVMLGQKMALELFESEALAVANKLHGERVQFGLAL
jgi:hypothetical protein